MDRNEGRPLRNYFTGVNRAAKDLKQIAACERLRRRIIEPVIDSSSSDEEYINERNEAQDTNLEAVSKDSDSGREERGNNEHDMLEALHSDYEDDMILEYEYDQENNAAEDIRGDEDDVVGLNFETEEQKANYVKETLREWATSNGIISKRKLDDLLCRLSPVFPTLPTSYKTLLHTPKYLEIFELPDGSKLWYKGIVTNLDAMLLDEYLEKYGNITIDVNMDGLPVAKSSRIKFWPQLGRLVHTENDPILIALYVGEWDPIDVHSYLHDFVTEVEHLLENGYIRNGTRYPFILRNFILDAPARSLVKCCIGHNGYSACEKCTVVGEFIDNRMTFLDLDAPLRTDQSFRNQDDPLHHTGVTILLRIAHMFIVVKFKPTPEDHNIYYEVALAKWLAELDDNMMGKLLWPKHDSEAGKLVRCEANADKTWQQVEVEVKRYCETYIAARNAAKGFEEFSSAYESESGSQMGRGKRKKRLLNRFTSDDDSSGSETWKQKKLMSKIPVAPYPPLLPASLSSQKKVSYDASKENITGLTVISNMKQGKKASAAPTAAGTIQKNLVQKIVNLRQQAAEKAQQRKKAMSLKNISKMSVTKETVDSTLCSEVSGKMSEPSGHYKFASECSSITSQLNAPSVEQLSDCGTKSNDINLPQSFYRSSSDKTENPYLCPSTSFASNYVPQAPLRNFNESVATENRNKNDMNYGEVCVVSSQIASTSTKTTDATEFNAQNKSCDKLSQKVDNLEQKVDNMRAKLDTMLINQSKIIRGLLPEEKVLSKPANIPALPLETIQQVTIFEQFISDDINLSDTCYYLKSLPLGNNEPRAVSKLMSYLMTNSLAQEFNFDGHGAKLAFKSTKLWELVQGTLLLKFEDSDLTQALTSIRSWLRNAKGRKLT